jgi:PAS domain S-box-containing protein
VNFYRRLVEKVPVGIAISTRVGQVLAMNRQLRDMAGISLDEATHTPASAFYANPRERKRLVRQLQQSGRVAGAKVAFKRKDGSRLLGLVRAEEIVLGREKVMVTTVQDITLQEQAEKAVGGVAELLRLFTLKRSRQDYLEAVVRFLRDWCACRCVGIRLLGVDGRVPYAAQVGFGRAFLQQEIECVFRPDGCACARILTGNPRPEDLRHRSRGGTFFCNEALRFATELGRMPRGSVPLACISAGYQSLAQTPIRYHGRLLGTIQLADPRPNRFPPETIRFVESVAPLLGEAIQRSETEESLRQSEVRFRSMFERHNAVMLLIEPESGAVVDANPAAAAFYGWSQHRLRHMNINQLNMLPPDTIAACRHQAMLERRNFFVFPHRLASGETRVVEVHSSPVEVEGRKLLFSVIHDVTERRLLEQQVLDISERERQRLGRDLHDSLGGKLTGAALMVKALAQRLAALSTAEAALAQEVVQCVNECIGQTRSIARGLCPVELSVAGLGSALEELAAETQRRSAVVCRFHAEKGAQVKNHFAAFHLFRIAQEAVANAMRHGQPREISIRLSTGPGQTVLEVATAIP